MTPEELDRSRSVRIRRYTVLSLFWMTIAAVFAIVNYTTTLNVVAGVVSCVLATLILAGFAVALRLKQSQSR